MKILSGKSKGGSAFGKATLAHEEPLHLHAVNLLTKCRVNSLAAQRSTAGAVPMRGGIMATARNPAHIHRFAPCAA
jgi:hypothetical protein